MKIVFENDSFVFVNKAPMVLTVPPRMKDKRPVLGLQLQEKLKIQIFPVHRLDFEVSGLVCFAKNEKAHRKSQYWFEDQRVVKYYEAVTTKQSFGHWPGNVANPKDKIDEQVGSSFQWESKILRGKKRSFFSPAGDMAQTVATIEKVEPQQLVWILNPITGKPHQLRLELSFHGFPIHGDELYGSKIKSNNGISLHSYKLDFSKINKDHRFELPDVIEVERKFQ